MSLSMMDEATHRRFDALCKLAKNNSGPGLTLNEISDAAELARLLESEEPDPGRVETLADRLGLELEALTITMEER